MKNQDPEKYIEYAISGKLYIDNFKCIESFCNESQKLSIVVASWSQIRLLEDREWKETYIIHLFFGPLNFIVYASGIYSKNKQFISKVRKQKQSQRTSSVRLNRSIQLGWSGSAGKCCCGAQCNFKEEDMINYFKEVKWGKIEMFPLNVAIENNV